jgi:hypothetical protein
MHSHRKSGQGMVPEAAKLSFQAQGASGLVETHRSFALPLRSVCRLSLNFHGLSCSSVAVHVVESRFCDGFDSFRAHHFFSMTYPRKSPHESTFATVLKRST